jgi:catechol 2,3-dioxygenase-like lactoylglutathione lyase family enzyme
MPNAPAVINATSIGGSLTCKELETSIRFYRDAIGFAVAQSFEHDGKVVASVVEAGDCRLVLNQDDGKLGWDRIKGQGFYLHQCGERGGCRRGGSADHGGGRHALNEPADRPWVSDVSVHRSGWIQAWCRRRSLGDAPSRSPYRCRMISGPRQRPACGSRALSWAPVVPRCRMR